MGDTSGSLTESLEAGLRSFGLFYTHFPHSRFLRFPRHIVFLDRLATGWHDRGMARNKGSDQVAMTDRPERSLDAEMRAPSTTTPDVVVLDFVEDDTKAQEVADPKKDLWLSSVDG